MKRLVRRLRILEYVGTEEWVNRQVDDREVKGRKLFANGKISEAWLGDTNELVNMETETHK